MENFDFDCRSTQYDCASAAAALRAFGSACRHLPQARFRAERREIDYLTASWRSGEMFDPDVLAVGESLAVRLPRCRWPGPDMDFGQRSS